MGLFTKTRYFFFSYNFTTNTRLDGYEKPITNRNPLNCSEDSDIKLITHNYFNIPMFAVLLPDGGMLNFVANSMKALKQFENSLNFYDPPF